MLSAGSLFAAPTVPQISDSSNEYYYHIVFQRYHADLALEDKGAGEEIAVETIDFDSDAQLWKVEDLGTGYYKFISKLGNSIYYDATAGVERFKAGAEVTGLAWSASTNGDYGADAWVIYPEINTEMSMNPFGGSEPGKTIGLYYHSDGGNAVKFIDKKGALWSALLQAADYYHKSVVGDDFGQFSASVHAHFGAIINATHQIYEDETSTSEQVETAIYSLTLGIQNFLAQQNMDLSLLLSSNSNNYRWYKMVNQQYEGRVISSVGRAAGEELLVAPEAEAGEDGLWRFEVDTDNQTVKFINKTTGLSIEDKGQSTAALLIDPASGSDLQFYSTGVAITAGRVDAGMYQYFHSAGHYTLVGWEINSGATKWQLEFVEETAIPTDAYTVTVSVNDDLLGSAVITGTEDTSAEVIGAVSVSAAPTPGSVFTEWKDITGATVSTSATYTFTPTADIELTAVFENLGKVGYPLTSSAAAPIYYYIQSASDGSHAFNGYTGDFRSHVMISPNNLNGSKNALHNTLSSATTPEHALWQIEQVDGKVYLKNVATGYYFIESREVSDTKATVEFGEIGNSGQYKLFNTGVSSYANTWQNNEVDRLTSDHVLENGLTAWYFISPSELNSKIAEAVNVWNTTREGIHPGQYPEAARNDLLNAINDAIDARDDEDPNNDVAAITALEAAVTTYTGLVNELQISDASNEYWYWIKGTRGATATSLFAEEQGTGNQVLNKVRTLTDSQLWKIVENGSGYALQNKETGEYMNTNIGNNGLLRTETDIPSDKPVYFNKSSYANDAVDHIQYYLIEDNTTSSGVSFRMHAGAGGHNHGLMNYIGNINDHCSFQFLLYDENELLASNMTASVHSGKYTTTGQGNENHGLSYVTLTSDISIPGEKLNSVTIDLEGTTSAAAISKLKLYYTGSSDRLNPANHTLIKTLDDAPFSLDDPIVFDNLDWEIPVGATNLYIAADIAENAPEGTVLDNRILSVNYTNSLGTETIIPAETATSLYSIVYLTRTVVLEPGDYGSTNYRIPALITLKEGSLLAVTDKRKFHSGDLPGDIDIVAQKSIDAGKTWSEPVTVALGTGQGKGFGDACITQAPSGKIIALFVGGRQFQSSVASDPIRSYMSTSTDNGETWSDPVDLTDQLYGAGCEDEVRKHWKGAFFGSGRGLTTSSGRVMGVMTVNPASGPPYQNYVIYSDDEGATWKVSDLAINGGDEAKVVELDNGDILMSSRIQGNRLWAKSTDKGVTWTSNGSWSEIWGNACDADIVRYTSVNDGYDKSRLLHTLPNSGSREKLTMWMSEDEGTTWPVKKLLVPGTSAYSSITKLPDGTIGVYFEEDGSVPYTMTFIRFSLDFLTSGAESYTTSPNRAYRTKASGDWSNMDSWEVSSDVNVWVTPTQAPTAQAAAVTVQNGHELNIEAAAAVGVMTVKAGAQLTVASTGSLTAGNVILESDATGTATLVGDYSGNATVEQHLNMYRSWYMSAPVIGEFNETFYSFDEPGDKWSLVESKTLPAPGRGIMVNPTAAGTVSFSGTLNNGNISAAELSSTNRRFNYLGNPYPSYLNWSQLSKTNLEGSVWFRTVENGGYVFAVLNALGVGTFNADNNIAPMQGFWVRVEDGKTGSLEFNNGNRTHYNAGHKQLRAPQAEFPILRLEITDGTLRDEAIVYFKEENLNGKDRFDAAKMMNGNNIPEIWTLINNEATVINAMQTIPYNVEMPLGFNTKKADSFTIRATEFKGFDANDRVMLIDKVAETSMDITELDYSFSSDAVKTNDRFAIKFVPGTVTGVGNNSAAAVTVYTHNNDLVLSVADFNNTCATVFSVNGQQIASQELVDNVTTLAIGLKKGVYLVVVESDADRVTKRVVVK